MVLSNTKQDIEGLINHRRLLTPAPYKKTLRNDDYEQFLADALVEPNENGEEVESILPDLPLVIISDAERMFLKDLISDTRANWLLSPELCQILSTELKNCRHYLSKRIMDTCSNHDKRYSVNNASNHPVLTSYPK